MNLGMQMRLLSRPGRASGLARFHDYAAGKKDVQMCKREENARRWLEKYSCEVAR
jgi:allantoinase